MLGPAWLALTFSLAQDQFTHLSHAVRGREEGHLSLAHAIPQLVRGGASSPSVIPLGWLACTPVTRVASTMQSEQGVGPAQNSASEDGIFQGHLHGLWGQQGPRTSIQTLVATGP